MHSHKHASLNMVLFNYRLKHVCLDELFLITCYLDLPMLVFFVLIYCLCLGYDMMTCY